MHAILTFLQLYEHSKCNYASACVLQADMHRQVHVHADMPCKFNHYMHACFARNYPEHRYSILSINHSDDVLTPSAVGLVIAPVVLVT